MRIGRGVLMVGFSFLTYHHGLDLLFPLRSLTGTGREGVWYAAWHIASDAIWIRLDST